MDEIFPIAFAITTDNEKCEGWKDFCHHTQKACPTLHLNRVEPRCNLLDYFTCVFDCGLGVQEALKEVFLNNHQTRCSFYIQRNVLDKNGMSASKCVPNITNTYSTQQEDVWLIDLNTQLVLARKYIDNITPEIRRNTSWILDDSLPPASFGITNSNVSESANCMFETARDCSWFDTRIDLLLNIMTTQIAKLRKNTEEKSWVIPNKIKIKKGMTHLQASY